MRMLRWMSGNDEEDKIRNEYIRSSIGIIVSIVDKMKESRLGWLRHVLKREETLVAGRLIKEMFIEGKRGEEVIGEEE